MLTRQDKEKHCMQWRPGHGKHAVELEEQPSQLREGRPMTCDQLNHIPGTLPTAPSPQQKRIRPSIMEIHTILPERHCGW
jgi:hypothetical protein